MSYPKPPEQLERARLLLKWTRVLIDRPGDSPLDLDILVQTLEAFVQYARHHLPPTTGLSVDGHTLPPDSPLTELKKVGLSGRAHLLLQGEGIQTIGQLLQYSGDQLTGIRQFGALHLAEVERALAYWGLMVPD